ncbi:family 10 glycosylhydrolase [bacterium]|nr:family 10 glycosylhydrolase [bacterium]
MKHGQALLVLLLFGFLSLCSSQALLYDQQQIIMLGDSITEGEDPDGYVNLTRVMLEQLYPEKTIYVANAGKGGNICIDMLERLERDVLRFKPDWVTVSVGVNDVSTAPAGLPLRSGETGVPVATFKAKVKELIHRIKVNGSQVALFTTTVVKEDLSSAENVKLIFYNDALRDLAQKNQCVLVDMDRAFRQVLSPKQKPGMALSGVLTSDGVHMLASGNWLMAETLLNAFGASRRQINSAKPAALRRIARQKTALAENLAHYASENGVFSTAAPQENRLVLIGSSLAARWNVATAFSEYQTVNRGLEAETIRQLRMRFHQDAVALKPDAVFIFPDYLDDLRKMSPVDVLSHLARIARLAKGSAIPVTLGSTLPVSSAKADQAAINKEKIAALNERIKELCAENGYFYLDCFNPLADEQGFINPRFTVDSSKLNAAGYEALRPLVDTVLQRLRWQTFDLRLNGTIPIWSVAGRFPNADFYHHTEACFGYFRDWLIPIGGENLAIARQGDRIPYEENNQVAWISACSDSAGLLDYLKILAIDNQTAGVSYAYCRLLSSRDQRAVLHIRSNDGVRVWLNQQMVHDHHVGRPVSAEEDHTPVTLRPGANPLLIKVDQSGGGWALVVRVTDEEGQPIQGVTAAVRDQLSARQVEAAKKGDLHAFTQSDEPIRRTPLSQQFEFSINGQLCSKEQSDYSINPGRQNVLTIQAGQEGYWAELTRLSPDGQSQRQRIALQPEQTASLNLGLFAMPAVFEYRAGVVFRSGYRFTLAMIKTGSESPVEKHTFLQTISADNRREVLRYGQAQEHVHIGWEAFEAHQPMDPPVLLWLDQKVLEQPDSVTICFQLSDAQAMPSLPGLLRVQNLQEQKPLVEKKVQVTAHVQRLRLKAGKWRPGSYRITFKPEVPGCNDHDGPSLVYHRRAKKDQVPLSPYALWAFARDRARKDVMVTNFAQALEQWSTGLPQASHWRLVGDSDRTCLVNDSGDWQEPPVVLRPGLKGWYAIFVHPVKGYCYVRAGKSGVPRGAADAGALLAAMDLTDEELAVYATLQPGSGLQKLHFVPIIQDSAEKLLAFLSHPAKPLIGVADWGDYFCPPPIFHSAGGRPAQDQFDVLLRGHAELGIRSINWALGRSCLLYHSQLPDASLFPSIPLDKMVDQSSRADLEVQAWIIARQDQLSYVLEHRDQASVKIIPWLTMNRHYGEFYDEGIGASKWFKAHPEWRRWRKNAYGPCQGEVSFFFPQVRQERLDIFSEVAAKSPDGLLVGACRQPPMLGYEPEMVKAYQQQTGINPKNIDASQQPAEYEKWIRWRADFFTETLRELRDRLEPIRSTNGGRVPVSIRIPSKGFFINMAQGLDVETWCREKLIDRMQLDPLEDCDGAGSHDITPYIELGRRYGVEVYGGISCNTWWNVHAICRRALGLWQAGADGLELYESNNYVVLRHQRWLVPLLGNAGRLEYFLQTSNVSACFPIWSRNAASGHDNHSFRDSWSVYDGQGWGL